LIQKMLSQSIILFLISLMVASSEEEYQSGSAPTIPEYANQRVLYLRNTNVASRYAVPTKLTSHDSHIKSVLEHSTIGDSSAALLEEEIRRSKEYSSLVRAQRRYAEKLSIPTGPGYRFTTEEWDSLGQNLGIEEWEGGFLDETRVRRHCSSKATKKENMLSPWKGKEKALEGESDHGDLFSLRMKV
jgi:hypothetical protein